MPKKLKELKTSSIKIGESNGYSLYLTRHGNGLSFGFYKGEDIMDEIYWEPEDNPEKAIDRFIDEIEGYEHDEDDNDCCGAIYLNINKTDNHLIFIFDQYGGNARIHIHYFKVVDEDKFRERLAKGIIKLFDDMIEVD